MISLLVFVSTCYLNALCSFLLGVLVLIKSKKSYAKILFFFYLSIVVWSIGLGSEVISPNKSIAYFWVVFLLIGVILIPPTFLHFVLSFTLKLRERLKVLVAAYIIAGVLLLFNFMGLLVNDVRPIYYFNFYVQPSMYYIFLLIYFGVCVVYCFYELTLDYLKSTSIKRNQIMYFLVSAMIGYIGGSATFLPKYNIYIPSYILALYLVHPLAIAYAILSYRLLGVRIIAGRLASQIFTISVFIAGIFFLGRIIKLSQIIFALVSIALFYIIHKAVYYLIRKVLPHKNYDELLSEYTQNLMSCASIEDVFAYVVDFLRDKAGPRPKSVLLFVQKGNNGEYLLQNKTGINIGSVQLNEKSSLVKLVRKEYIENDDNKDIAPILIKDELDKLFSYEKIAKTVKEFDDLNSQICIPLIVRAQGTENNIIGFMFLGESEISDVYDEKDYEFFRKAAMQTAQAIEQVEIREILHRERIKNLQDNYQKHLIDASKRITYIRNIEDLCKEVVHIILRSANAVYAGIYLYNAEEEKYIKGYEKGSMVGLNNIDSVEEGNALVKLLRDREQEIFYTDLKKWADETKFTDMKQAKELVEEMGVSIVLPIILEGLLGFIVIGEKRSRHAYDRSEMNTLHMISNNVGIVIQNIYVSRNVVRDSLTGLYNKGYADKSIKDNIEKAIINSESASLLLIDIDFFKKYNDTYGHQQGDDILKLFSQYIKDTGRPTDIPCRYGGEEFVIILPDTNMDGAKVFAERLRSGLKHHKILKSVTISIGAGTFTGNLDSTAREKLNYNVEKLKDMLVKRTDDALYKAKETGRDKTCVSDEMKLASSIGKGLEIQKVLLIEDDEQLSNTVKNFLQLKGYELEIKNTAEAGLDSAKKFRPDVVLLDLALPDVDGSIVLDRLLDMGITSHIAIFSASGDRKEEVMKKGAKKFFLKPTELTEIEDWLKQLS
ncbi:MAG: diguanylate cyclase [Elusimicrobiota bacterium]